MISNTKAAKGIFTSKILSSQIFWIVSFSILTVVSAQIAIPVKPVPFTLQTMIVLLAGAFLGAKNGAYSQILYLLLGAAGLPVFSNGAFGAAHLFGPTGGYLLAFPIGAFFTGYFIEKNKNYLIVVVSMFIGELLIIFLGMLFLNVFYINNLGEAVKVGAALFSLWTVIKVFAAASIYFGISKKHSKLTDSN